MSLPVIVFPDVEMWACQYLQAALGARPEAYTDAYVGNTVPSPRQDRMVVVRRDGGPRLDVVREAARLTVRVWATSEQEATDLTRLVSALLWAAPNGNPVLRVDHLTGTSPVPDESRQPLRLTTFEVIVRGSQDDQPVVAPPGPDGYATTAVAGKPGYFLPTTATLPPTLADMSGVNPLPGSKWKGVEYVATGDGGHATWSGTEWAQNPN